MSTPLIPDDHKLLFESIQEDLNGHRVLGLTDTNHYKGMLAGIHICLYNLEIMGYGITSPNGVPVNPATESSMCPNTELWKTYVDSINS